MPQSSTTPSAYAHLSHLISQQNYPAATLYVVPTPIGNIGDITFRALHVLSIADQIACEDTRNTAQLLSHYGLKKKLQAIHQHNERERAAYIVSQLESGARVALVSDAGTPGISDPGARLIQAVREAGYKIVALPGACAATTALSVSGMLNPAFHFAGFMPTKNAQRDIAIQKLSTLPATLIFYEAPHRIVEMVSALATNLDGKRRIVIARELTKLFEELHSCALEDASAWLKENNNRQKGEFVLLIDAPEANVDTDETEMDKLIHTLLSECSVRQAASLAAKISGEKKNKMYDRALQIKKTLE